MNERVRLREREGNDADSSVTPLLNKARAVLVSERHAVWTRGPAAQDEQTALRTVSDPIWDHACGTRWTPDLVHCRLVDVAITISRLPSASIGRMGSILAQLADRQDVEVQLPPTAAEITIADWTWGELIKLDPVDRGIAVGMAFGLTVRRVAKRLGKAKSTVADNYMHTRRHFAARWIRLKHPVDASAFNRWTELFEKERK